MTELITVHFTPGELLESVHALRSMTRFNNTEQRDNNQSAINKLVTAYNEQAHTRCRSCALLEVSHQDDNGVFYYTCPHAKPEDHCLVDPNQIACPYFTEE